MSHRATVAYANEDGTFDLHYSHNGAEGYVLKDVLERYLEGKVSKDADGMPGLMPAQVGEVMRDSDGVEGVTVEAVEHDLIESEPSQEGVPKEALAGVVNFSNCEALYVVEDWEVSVYAPIHLSAMVLPQFEGTVTVEFYDTASVEGGLQQVMQPGVSPTERVSKEDFTDPAVLDTLPEEMYELLEQFHLDILDFYNKTYRSNKQKDTYAILAGEYVMSYTVENPSTPMQNVGLFVEVWGGGENTPRYPWMGEQAEGDSGTWYPRSWANKERFRMSRDTMDRITARMEGLGVDRESNAAMEIMQSEVSAGMQEFLTALVREFGEDIEDVFLPEQAADQISSLRERTQN